MKVILERDWFAPNGQYYRADREVKIPDELRDSLPTDAQIIKAKPAVKEAPAAKQTDNKDAKQADNKAAELNKVLGK